MRLIYSKKFRVVLLIILVLALSITRKVTAQEMPELYGVIPQEGQVGSDVGLVLDGTGFLGLPGLDHVFISGVEIPILDYAVASDDRIEVMMFIPEETPIGETEISFLFGDFPLDAYFVVRGFEGESSQPAIFGVFPQEGQPGSEIELRLDGQNFFELGGLGGVILNGAEIPVLDMGIESNETMFIRVLIPEDIPPGEGEMDIFFANAEFSDSFFVGEPGIDGPDDGTRTSPPDRRIWVLVFILIVLVPIVRRVFRRKPEKPKKEPSQPPPVVPEFEVKVDPGVQQVEPANQPLKMDFELSLIISKDSGDQPIEMHQGKLVESK